jgi:2-methylcitrate dehydratase
MTYEDLTPERRERLKVSILDSLECAINALGASPTAACLAQAKEFGGANDRCTLIGGGKANIVHAALYNTALVRYIGFMDSYLAGPELCHPSDNTGAVLAACEHTGRSGKEFLTALAVAYQVQSELTASVPFMERGFDLTTALTYSVGAGVAKALGLDEAKTAAAMRSNRISAACCADHSDLAMEGPVLVASCFRVCQRGLPGIARSNRPEVCD